MENRYLLSLRPTSLDRHPRNDGLSFDYDITDEDGHDDFSPNSPTAYDRGRTGSNPSYQSPSSRPFKPAQPWPCRPCGLLLGVSHILLGMSVIIFDVTTNWVTETVFAITAGICFVNSGIVGLIAARKLDRGTITLFVIFSLLSLGLSSVLIVECSAALNHACLFAITNRKSVLVPDEARSDIDAPQASPGYACVYSIEARVRAALLILTLLEGVVDVLSILVGAKSLCNRYAADLQNPSSPYHALIYGDLAPPPPPKRIVQDIGCEITSGHGGRRLSSRLLFEYLALSPATSPSEVQRSIVKN